MNLTPPQNHTFVNTRPAQPLQRTNHLFAFRPGLINPRAFPAFAYAIPFGEFDPGHLCLPESLTGGRCSGVARVQEGMN